MQCERVPNDHLPECGQQNLDSECVLLMEGKLVRRILGSVQQQVWNLGQTLLDDASSSFRPGTNRYSLPFTFTNVGRSNRKGCLARDRHLRTFAACDVDRLLVVWIESDELAARYRLHEEIYWATVNPIVLNALFWRCRPHSMPRRISRCRLTSLARFKCVARVLLRRSAPIGHRRPCSSPALLKLFRRLRIRRDSGVILIGR
jgi:hypothetical protein